MEYKLPELPVYTGISNKVPLLPEKKTTHRSLKNFKLPSAETPLDNAEVRKMFLVQILRKVMCDPLQTLLTCDLPEEAVKMLILMGEKEP